MRVFVLLALFAVAACSGRGVTLPYFGAASNAAESAADITAESAIVDSASVDDAAAALASEPELIAVTAEAPATEAPATEALSAETPAKRGLLGGLFRRGASSPAPVVTADARAEPEPGASVETAAQEIAPNKDVTRPGLFSRLLGGAGQSPNSSQGSANLDIPAVATLPEPTVEGDGTAQMRVPDAPAEITPAAAPAPRRGLFARLGGGGNRQNATPPANAPDMPGDTTLAYGAVARVCDLSRRDLGKEVARYPETGSVAYRLFDSDPSTIALRAHYITGFADGCPRKFSAALAVFGGPNAYETTRYRDGRNDTNVTRTDTEYKRIRARVCSAPVERTCSSSRFATLERSTVFVSVYDRFGTNPKWADMLIHNGTVVAKDFKEVR